MAFVDLTKAFDAVDRDQPRIILVKVGCLPTFISMLQQFHSDMRALVAKAGSQSSSFPIDVGVE